MGNKFNAKPITKGRLEWAYAQVKSASQAARLLNVDFKTFKKYAQQFDMYEQFCNKAGKGIAKHYNLHSGKYALDDILDGKYPSYDIKKLHNRLINSGYFQAQCGICEFSEQRVTDGKVPIKIDFVDGDKTNHKRENVRFLCFNCFYLNVGNLSGRKKVGIDNDNSIVNDNTEYGASLDIDDKDIDFSTLDDWDGNIDE